MSEASLAEVLAVRDGSRDGRASSLAEVFKLVARHRPFVRYGRVFRRISFLFGSASGLDVNKVLGKTI